VMIGTGIPKTLALWSVIRDTGKTQRSTRRLKRFTDPFGLARQATSAGSAAAGNDPSPTRS
jgi:hypothetical protein